MSFRFRSSVWMAVVFFQSLAGVRFVQGENWTATCRQVVSVVTPEWESTRGRLCTLEKTGENWIAVGRAIEVTVGRAGLGWGLGLQSGERYGPVKREGDKRAPAGIFWLESGFGTERLTLRKFDYRRTNKNDRWVDDPVSAYYNRWVELGEVEKDWTSAEVLRRPDGIYDYVIVVGHNRDPIVPGRGSAIFLHSWFGESVPTIGCTAMARKNVKNLLKWLDRKKHPVLIQVPDSELDTLGLPFEVALIRTSL